MKYLLGLFMWIGVISFSAAQTSAQEPEIEAEEGMGFSCFMVDEENIICLAVPEGTDGLEFTPEEPYLEEEYTEPGRPSPFDEEEQEELQRKEERIIREDEDGKIRVLL
ncbi:MAG: hypothetical protein ACK40G_02985 [Cytophagaceae bacterium]